MTIRIPIIGQSTSAAFVPQERVQPIIVSDPRGRALQGLGEAIGNFGDTYGKYRQAQDARQKKFETEVPANQDRDDTELGQATRENEIAANQDQEDADMGQAMRDNILASQRTEDTNAWIMRAYADTADYGAQLAGHLDPGAAPAPAPAGGHSAGPTAPNFSQLAQSAMQGGGLGGILSALQSGGSASDAAASSAAPATNPSLTNPDIHGHTGAWINGYDLAGGAAIAAAPDKSAADSLAQQIGFTRTQGARAMIASEAQANVARRQNDYLAATRSIAGSVVAANPESLPQVLAFVRSHPIRVDGDQKAFDAQVQQTLTGAAMKTLIARDPQAVADALQDGKGADAYAEHPVFSQLTDTQRTIYQAQAQGQAQINQSAAQAGLMQRFAATRQSFERTGAADNPPTLAEYTGLFGAQRGAEYFARQNDADERGRAMKLYGTLSTAQIEDERNNAQAGLHATASANADTLGQSAPAGAAGFGLHAPAAIADPAYAARARSAANQQSAADAILGARRSDSMQAALDAGTFGLKPADMSTTQGALDAVTNRAPVAGVIAEHHGAAPVLFSNAEAQSLTRLAAGLPAQERAAFFRQLTHGIGDDALARATLAQIGAYDPVLGAAARLQLNEEGRNPAAAGQLDAPQLAFTGYAALHPAKGEPALAMPPDAQTRQLPMPPLEGETPAQAEARYGLARAIYAGMVQQDGGSSSGELDQQRWLAAQRLATSGSGTAGEVGLGFDRTQETMDSRSNTDAPSYESQGPTTQDTQLPGEIGADGDKLAMGHGAGKGGAQINRPRRFSRPLEYINALDKNTEEGRTIGLQHAIAEGQFISADDKDSGASSEEREAARRTLIMANQASRKWNNSRAELLEMIDAVGGGLQPDEEYELAVRRALSNLTAATAINTQGIAKTSHIAKREIVPKGFSEVYNRAPEAKQEVDAIGERLAAGADGSLAKSEIKSVARAVQKVDQHFPGEPEKLNDLARNTVVAPEHKHDWIVDELKRMGASIRTFEAEKDALGYSGTNATIKTNAGIPAEIQVNTPEMIYAKEREPVARAILGDKAYNEIAEKVRMPGGLGHKYYEQYRVLDANSAPAKAIAEKSRAYYNAIRSANGNAKR